MITWDEKILKKFFIFHPNSSENVLVGVQYIGCANILSNAGKIGSHLISQRFSADKGPQKKIKSNLAKSDSWSTARKYFSNESLPCVLIGVGLVFTNVVVVRCPTMLRLGCCSKRTSREKYLDVPPGFAAGKTPTLSAEQHCCHTGLLHSHKAWKSAWRCRKYVRF